ncbi:MAG: 3-oxoacyl-[acyl-carrier-protein] reductase [Syntrophomonas sp.]
MFMNNQVAVVTGSSRGIGKAIALQLAADGYRIVVNYYNQGNEQANNKQQAEEVLAEISAAGGSGIIIGADVSDPQSAQNLVDKTVQEMGQIDVLVNNAGINKDQLILRITNEDWDRIINTNLNSAFYCSRAAIKYMVKKRFGRIITISSVVGLGGNAGQAHYAATKAGLLGLTFSIAKEYGSRGITANAVAPGFIQSDMTDALTPQQSTQITSGISVGRLGTPEDVAGAVAFLASPRASYISGQVIRVDGGMSI